MRIPVSFGLLGVQEACLSLKAKESNNEAVLATETTLWLEQPHCSTQVLLIKEILAGSFSELECRAVLPIDHCIRIFTPHQSFSNPRRSKPEIKRPVVELEIIRRCLVDCPKERGTDARWLHRVSIRHKNSNPVDALTAELAVSRIHGSELLDEKPNAPNLAVPQHLHDLC